MISIEYNPNNYVGEDVFSDTFANYNKQIPNELYLDSEGKTLGYTYAFSLCWFV